VSTYPRHVKTLQATAACYVKRRGSRGAWRPPRAVWLPPQLVVVVMAADAHERVGARGARALDLDAVARLELRDVEARPNVAADAADGADAAVDGDVAVSLARLRFGRLAAAGGEHDGVAAGGAAAELPVRETACRRPVGGEVRDELAPRRRAATVRETGDV